MIFIRTFSMTSIFMSKSLRREGRFLNKIMTQGTPKKKYRFMDGNSATPLLPDQNAKYINHKRITVLNTLFMESITDMISTGNVDPIFIEKGVEISKVVVSPNFKTVNVFWYSSLISHDDNSDSIERVLNKAERTIHHELSQLRIMGYVPKVSFVKDKRKNKMVEIQNLLEQIKVTTENVDDEEVERDEEIIENLPEMAHDVYGLNHEKIISKIMTAKARVIKRRTSTESSNKLCTPDINIELSDSDDESK